jgi:hypothetical protein
VSVRPFVMEGCDVPRDPRRRPYPPRPLFAPQSYQPPPRPRSQFLMTSAHQGHAPFGGQPLFVGMPPPTQPPVLTGPPDFNLHQPSLSGTHQLPTPLPPMPVAAPHPQWRPHPFFHPPVPTQQWAYNQRFQPPRPPPSFLNASTQMSVSSPMPVTVPHHTLRGMGMVTETPSDQFIRKWLEDAASRRQTSAPPSTKYMKVSAL